VSTSSWCPGNALIRTYKIEELLGTKLRALYQRRKGRDLFDLSIAIQTFPDLDVAAILNCFRQYLLFTGNRISKAEFLENMEEKLNNREFREDMIPLLPHQSQKFDPDAAYQLVKEKIIEKL